MTEKQKSLPTWILIVSGIFALLEIMVSMQLWFTPESVMENVDHSAKGMDYLFYMWAARQFALGFIFAFATLKKSIPMLTLAYIFLLVMMLGDMVIGISQKENALVFSALFMSAVSSAMIYAINKRKRK